ncbi:hypothetical protein CR513_50115, partial [Mucuna pruriens]
MQSKRALVARHWSFQTFQTKSSLCIDQNLKSGKLHGMKSHNYHVFMQWLPHTAFDSLPMEDNIPMLLCKLEQIFLSTFFDSMEHLLIHLLYEARVGGLVQYCWMYHFERFLHFLKNKVKNKAKVEASICEAYLVEETSTLTSFYYPNKIETRRIRKPCNVDSGEGSSFTPPISIFNYP